MNFKKDVQGKTFERAFSIVREEGKQTIDEEKRTVEVAFSSEEPYGRWFGNEILDHSPSAVRLGRLESGGAVLMGHDHNDQVGVVESVRIDADRRGRAVLRFGKSQRADEIFQDVKDGIRSLISVGYRVLEMKLEETQDEGEDTYRVTEWEPFEISFVSVPADATVGVGRSVESVEEEADEPNHLVPKDDELLTADQVRQLINEVNEMTQEANTPAVSVEDNGQDILKAERSRVATIEEMGKKFGQQDFARDACNTGMSVDDFNRQLLDRVGSQGAIDTRSAEIGMTSEEVKNFSFVRAINALANPNNKEFQRAAGFEYECSRAAADAAGKESQGIMIPLDVLQRDLTVGTATAGGHTVATDLLSGSFIDMLRNRSSVFSRAMVLDGLVGNIAIPRQTGGATAYWVAESGAPTESQQAVDQVTMSPKTVGAFTDISRKLLIQSSLSVENFVRSDIARTIALELDRVGLNGSGASNQPEGVANVSGIGSEDIGTNGGAITWDKVVDLESNIAANNADVGSMAYITNAKVRGAMKKKLKASGVAGYIMENGMVNGYEAVISNQVLGNITKGTGTNLSQMFFGNFADLVYGLWSGLDLTVDPYTHSTSGTLRVVALQDADLAVRHAESFALIGDIDSAA